MTEIEVACRVYPSYNRNSNAKATLATDRLGRNGDEHIAYADLQRLVKNFGLFWSTEKKAAVLAELSAVLNVPVDSSVTAADFKRSLVSYMNCSSGVSQDPAVRSMLGVLSRTSHGGR